MGWWAEHVVPRVADRTLANAPVEELRERVCRGLRGRVVEIGFGSGLNVPHYPREVELVDAVDPSGVGWGLAGERVASARVLIRRAGLDGQVIEAPASTYDAALSTFTLCTIPDVATALSEIRRVLRPGGSFHFLEHGRSPDDRVAQWQSRVTPLQRRLGGGCHLDRPIDRLVEEAGFSLDHLSNEYLPGPALSRPFAYLYIGRAHA